MMSKGQTVEVRIGSITHTLEVVAVAGGIASAVTVDDRGVKWNTVNNGRSWRLVAVRG